jgi:ATP-dependent exoDNAse (exonuclease V) beta subunit
MTPRPLADQAARDRIARDLDATLVVEAAAGTGKTTALVGRVLALLASGRASLARVACVTFTEKAAGEMKLRLRAEIERARRDPATDDAARGHLDRALAELEAAKIGTIHAFCADILRERPVEARVDPLFEVSAEDETERLYDECFERFFQAALSDPPEGIRRVLRRRKRDQGSEGPKRALRDAGYKLLGQRDFTADWTRPPFDRDAEIDRAMRELEELSALAKRADRKNYLVEHLEQLSRAVTEITRREAVREGRDYDGLEADLRSILRMKGWTWQGSGKMFGPEILRADVLARRDAGRANLTSTLDRCDADLAACLYRELTPLVARFEDAKAKSGRLDFLDLLVKTRDLLVKDRPVREELQRRFTHLLVDEFQDTDPLQAEILLLIAADDPGEEDGAQVTPIPGKLFVVGDPKQSIYRFRRADVSLYEAIKARLLERGASLVHLTSSFRGSPSIQSVVNAAFAPVMTGQKGQADYVALSATRDDATGRPSVIALPVPRPYSDYGRITSWSIEKSAPDVVGAFVDWLVGKSGWKVPTPGGGERPFETRDVCLLFKRLVSFGSDLTRPYVRALEARRLAHVLVGGKSFHEREEVIALRTALAAIEWPDDEHAVYATLRGPYFALGDDALLAARARGPLHPMHAPDLAGDPLTEPVAPALAVLRALHLARNRRPIADTVRALLEETRAHAGIAIWPTGEQALANVLRVMDLARRFEARRATSFRSFVHKLEDDAERGAAGEAPAVEEGTDGVRIMTVHKAKGLEFPVVVLVDPTAPHTHKEPSRYVDSARGLWATPLAGCAPHDLVVHRDAMLEEDRHEAARLLYVAATRARDLLVVPVVGDERVEGWVDPLFPALYPKARARRASREAAGCPRFGRDSVALRPPRAERDETDSVMPGEHDPEAGDHRVVWWDPRALELDKEDEAGLRQQRILSADASGAVAREGEEMHAAWAARLAALRERGAVKSTVVRTVTERKADGAEADVTVEIVKLARPDGEARPSGKRVGVLVHAVLSAVALDAGPEAVARLAGVSGRAVGAAPAEIEIAAAVASRILAHPLLARARSASDVRREVALTTASGDDVTDGAVDLAFEEDDGWIVVDFKTDVDLGPREAAYVRQVALYARIVSEATGRPARGYVLSG